VLGGNRSWVMGNLVVAQDVNRLAGQPCRYPGCLLVVVMVVVVVGRLPCELRSQYPLVMGVPAPPPPGN